MAGNNAEHELSPVESAIIEDLKQRGCHVNQEHGAITWIAGPKLTDNDLVALIDCRSLKHLDLQQRSPPMFLMKGVLITSRQGITDVGMQHIGKITSLTHLHLGYTSVTSNGLVHLRHLINLQSLDLTGTSILIEDAVEHLQAISSLRWLDLRLTPRTAASPSAIEYLMKRNPNLKWNPGI